MLSPSQTTDVPRTFDGAAATYDRMVGLNPGYHRHLRSASQALLASLPPTRHGRVRIADLGCGSGASTAALSDALEAQAHDFEIIGVDASAGMLSQAQSKHWPARVRFVHGRAEDLSAVRVDGWPLEALDGVFAAYLFRNVAHRDPVLTAVSDLLTPGGVLVTQEYSVAGSRHARAIWTAVCWLVVIPLSWVLSRQTALYRYLWQSVASFDSVTEFTDRLHRAGFTEVEVRTVPGWQRGILHTFRARKAGPSPQSDDPDGSGPHREGAGSDGGRR